MTPDQLEQMERGRALQLHCQDMSLTRMNIVMLEAMACVKGWDVDHLQTWNSYNDYLMRLMRKTRTLLPF